MRVENVTTYVCANAHRTYVQRLSEIVHIPQGKPTRRRHIEIRQEPMHIAQHRIPLTGHTENPQHRQRTNVRWNVIGETGVEVGRGDGEAFIDFNLLEGDGGVGVGEVARQGRPLPEFAGV